MNSCFLVHIDRIIDRIQFVYSRNAQFSGRKIVLMTDFSGEFSDDQAASIISGLKNQEIDLSVM